MSKAGYCFVNLRSAVEFLLHVTGKQIGMQEADFNRELRNAQQLDSADAAPDPTPDHAAKSAPNPS